MANRVCKGCNREFELTKNPYGGAFESLDHCISCLPFSHKEKKRQINAMAEARAKPNFPRIRKDIKLLRAKGFDAETICKKLHITMEVLLRCSSE